MEGTTGLEIAVIGMSIKCPGATDVFSYWNNLRQGIESIKFLSEDELIEKGVRPEILKARNYIRASGALDNSEHFDAAFFNYLHNEAMHLDPQTRLYHEIVWEALENAGCNPDTYPGLIGLYVGVPENAMWKVHSALSENTTGLSQYYIDLLNNKDYLPMLVAHKLNLHGPAFSMNTACSSSLVSVHLACRAILTGDCTIAIAGGVHLGSNIKAGYLFEEGLIFSPDGHCRPFDEESNGTVISEGAGAVVLKKLTEAIKDNDHIYGIIKGSAINNDGNRKLGYMAPSIDGQVECSRKCLTVAKVDPKSISYIEAHGTGTGLGDPVELSALELAYQLPKDNACAIGSVKSNIGHLDAAAGVAGLIKTMLSLEKKELPATINFKKGNSKIDFENSAFYVNRMLTKWKRKKNEPLRAAVSSFGIGGTNSHVIVEEAQPAISGELESLPLMIFSARTKNSLIGYLQKFTTYLSDNKEVNLSDMAYSLALGRKEFQYRVSLSCKDADMLLNSLQAITTKELPLEPIEKRKPIVFMFSGQGAQYSKMGIEIYSKIPYIKKQIDKGFRLLNSLTNEDFKEIIFSGTDPDKVTDTKFAQPLLFVFEYAIASYLMHLGIQPKYMIGHSIGEYAAAALSGVLSYEDALTIVTKRGELMSALQKGSMLSVTMQEEIAKEYLKQGVSIASINGPDQIVFSGETVLINELSAELNGKDISNIILKTSHAFHSAMMDSILEDFRSALKSVKLNKPIIPFVSNLSGELIKSTEATSTEYWVQHLRQAVNFSGGIKTLISLQATTFIEVGPGKTLTTLLRQNIGVANDYLVVNMIPHPKDQVNDFSHFTERIGMLWSNGVDINWTEYFSNKNRVKIPLPTYSFEKIKYPVVVGDYHSIRAKGISDFKSKEIDILESFYIPSWKKTYLVKNEINDSVHYYLFFSDGSDFSNALIYTLNEKNVRFVVVTKGGQFLRTSDNVYSINPNDSGHFLELFNELQQRNIVPNNIIYHWNSGDDLNLSEQSNQHENIVGFFCLQNIIKSLSSIDAIENKRIFLVTNALHQVVGNENIAIEHAVTTGLLKVLSQEIPSVFACNIDVVISDSNNVSISKQILEEIQFNSTDKTVALRNSIRWVQHFENIKTKTPANSKIRKGGVYLITGGLGKLGYTIADHLVENYEAKVILMGRTKLPPANEWSSLSHAENSKVDLLKRLLQKGTPVEYISNDVSDQNEFNRLLADAETRMGKINGVIHAAGLLGDSSSFMHCYQINMENAVKQVAPKIFGIETLYSFFKLRDIDFVWLSSSLSSVLGGLGYSSYCAGNIFMDSFVTKNSEKVNNWISVNLDYLKLNDQKEEAFIGKNELLRLFEVTISLNGINQVIIAKGDFFKRIDKYIFGKREEEKQQDRVNTSIVDRTIIASNYVKPVSDVEIKLSEIWGEFLNLQFIGIEDDFFELGGDSLKAMAVLKLIHKEFDVEMNLSELFATSTIKLLAEKIKSEHWLKKEECKGEKSLII